MIKVVFVDRDGVINEDKGYVHKIEDFVFIEGVFDSFRHLNEKKYHIIVITNQSGIGREYYKEQDFHVITQWMIQKFKSQDIDVLDVLYCPHKPSDLCQCRKPNIGMFEQADMKYNIDKKKSWMIGDKESDIEAAIKFGITNTILIKGKSNISKKNNNAKFTLQSIKQIHNHIN